MKIYRFGCDYADRYQAKYAPACGCARCAIMWQQRQISDMRDVIMEMRQYYKPNNENIRINVNGIREVK